MALAQVKMSGQPNVALMNAISQAGKLSNLKRDWTPSDIQRIAREAQHHGNPINGERVHRRSELGCQKCHAIAGAGGSVGPDLTSIGASAQPDYIVESLLLPNAKIKEGFHSLVISTVSGKIHTGIKVSESETSIVLRDSDDQEVTIAKKDIDEKKDGRSLMPDGTIDSLTQEELYDLVRFLSLLGKVDGGFTVMPGQVVRRWQAAQASRELMTLINRQRLSAIADPETSIPWSTVYSTVSGELPLEDLPSFKPHRNSPPCMAVRFQLQVTTGGPIKLRLNHPGDLVAWLDGIPVDVSQEMIVQVTPGVRTMTWIIQPAANQPEPRTAPLRVELDEVPNSAARAVILNGKQ
jgi:putative heme-binding domain-containing protein